MTASEVMPYGIQMIQVGRHMSRSGSLPVRAMAPMYPPALEPFQFPKSAACLLRTSLIGTLNSPLLPHLLYPSQADDSEVLGAYTSTLNTGVLICVISSGLDTKQPDFVGNTITVRAEVSRQAGRQVGRQVGS